MSAHNRPSFKPRSPLAGAVRSAGRSGDEAAVRVSEVAGLGRVWLAPFRGRGEIVGSILWSRLGCALPPPLRFAEGEGLRLLWADAEGWYAEAAQERPGELLRTLRDTLGDAAALVDKSAMHALLRLSGPRVRDLLAKGCQLDLHPEAFPIGSCAPTAIEHCHIHIRAEAPDSFALLVPASVARSFWHWLEVSALEFGLRVEEG
ncbi:MAG: sarcosine oxidase subunit gamma [Kiloniellales bacterium]